MSIVEQWSKEDVVRKLIKESFKHGKTINKEIWQAEDLSPSVLEIESLFGTWSQAIRTARSGNRDYRRGEKIPAMPFAKFLEKEWLKILNAHQMPIGELSKRRTPDKEKFASPASILARRMGVSSRCVQRYRSSVNSDGNKVDSYYRNLVEDMLEHYGVPFEDIYPELTTDVEIEEDLWCFTCDQATTPIKGVCPWCETVLRK